MAAGSDVMGENLRWLAIILMDAGTFSPLASRIGWPAVLGELLLCMHGAGNLGLLGIHYFESIPKDSIIVFFAEVGGRSC
jgi:Kef-type K+ transport system membrane component KefB